MALRLRRDVQKASYYVWFLGAEEAKGLRGEHVINSVLPYLISRSRNMEPLKVTLQVSHKGIKIVQGSSKHLIPHSAITSSLQADDIVACVLLLYNPATKCPLHVHGYRCDSETTAQALNQQLQILINRSENQKRFEELENRLGILPAVIGNSNKSSGQHGKKPQYGVQRHHHELSPKRFSSSLGSDTGHSTRESECSEEHNGNSPISRSPPHLGPKSIMPNTNHHTNQHHINNNNNNIIPNQGNELFDSLAAELRAKLNGNGPPLLLPPRDYDTVHRSKGNLTAIELRRCRNSLIVGNTTPTIAEHCPTAAKGNSVSSQIPTNGNVKQVSSRGSSGIGSDLAPSPERQDLNSSSDDEHWSNEADNSVIALKPSQIPLERSQPIISHHVSQLQRKLTKIPQPEDSYLRDLPAKPYNPRPSNHENDIAEKLMPMGEPMRARISSKPTQWSKEDEIKPIIVRPTDYDAKFNRIIQAEREQKQHEHREHRDQQTRDPRYMPREHETADRKFTKLGSSTKYNEINHMLNKKLSLECESPTPQDELEVNSVESDQSTSEQIVMSGGYRQENLTDKQKFLEYAAKKSGDNRDKAPKYGARQRYVDPADLPFEKPHAIPGPNKYSAAHRVIPVSTISEEKNMEREGRTPERSRHHAINEPERRGHSREKSRERYSRSHERNPYRESESLPYIESMEKMIKSSAMRYKSYDGVEPAPIKHDNTLKTMSSRTASSAKSHKSEDIEESKNFKTIERRHDYTTNRVTSGPKDRFKDAKEKFCAMEERVGRAPYDVNDGKDYKTSSRSHRTNSPRGRRYGDWSDEDHLHAETPPPSPPVRSNSRSREHWEREVLAQTRNQRNHDFAPQTRDVHIKNKPQYVVESDNYQRSYTRSHSRDGHSPVTEERRPMRNERNYSPVREERSHGGERRVYEKQRVGHMYSAEMYPSQVVSSSNGGPTSMVSAKSLSNLNKGYRHSYAEPVFGRSAGRVGLAAVNPY